MAAAMNPPTQLYLIIGIVLLAVVLPTTRRVQPAAVDKRTNNDLYGNHPGTNPFN
jgi:hypothetical protein